MAINTGSSVSNSIVTQYIPNYLSGVMPARLYDQFAMPVGKDPDLLQKGETIQVNYLSKLAPATATISEATDVTPVRFRDSTATVSPTSRANAIQDSERLLIRAYTDYAAKRFERIGENMMESVDLLAQAAALQGTQVIRGAARASLDAGTAGHLLSDTAMGKASSQLMRQRSSCGCTR